MEAMPLIRCTKLRRDALGGEHRARGTRGTTASVGPRLEPLPVFDDQLDEHGGVGQVECRPRTPRRR